MTAYSSPVPVGCRLTSPFGTRWGTLHAGTDYGPPEPGQRGVLVTAVADGVVSRTGRGDGSPRAKVARYHTGLAVWQDLGVIGGDRMYAYYGHLDSILVKPGEQVRVGQVIGVMGGSGKSGASDVAVHLHFGVAQNTDWPVRRAKALGDPGWINADAWLRGKGIVVGKTAPVLDAQLASAVTAPDHEHVRSDAAIRHILERAGHITPRDSLGLGIERYQARQAAPYTLPHDRVWGPRTDAHYQWVVSLQRAMNRWRGADLLVDGDLRSKTVRRVRDLQVRNGHRGGAYWNVGGRVADGVPGPIFCKMLGIPPHPEDR